MRLGLKLDSDFADNPGYRQLYANHEILPFLYDAGVRAVETPIGHEMDEHRLIDFVRRCRRAGLRVSLHPYTEGSLCNPATFGHGDENPCRRLHERFLGLAAQIAGIQQAQTVVNLHPAAASRQFARRELVDKSVAFFAWAGQWCARSAESVRVVAELQIAANPDEDLQRVGDDYAELLNIVQRASVDACWDFGHAYMNVRRFGGPLEPLEPLRKRIAHVHCHDADREDHQPLIFGHVPWQRFLAGLVEVGYGGTVVIEVPAQRFLAAGGLETLTRSIHAVKNWADNTPGSNLE